MEVYIYPLNTYKKESAKTYVEELGNPNMSLEIKGIAS